MYARGTSITKPLKVKLSCRGPNICIFKDDYAVKWRLFFMPLSLALSITIDQLTSIDPFNCIMDTNAWT